MKKKLKYFWGFISVIGVLISLTGCSSNTTSEFNNNVPSASELMNKIPNNVNSLKVTRIEEFYEDGEDDIDKNVQIWNKNPHVVHDLKNEQYALDSGWYDTSYMYLHSQSNDYDDWYREPMKAIPNIAKLFDSDIYFNTNIFPKSIAKKMKLHTKSNSYVLSYTINNEKDLDTLINSIAGEISIAKKRKIATDRASLEDEGYTFEDAVIKEKFTKKNKLKSISYKLDGKVDDGIDKGTYSINIIKSNFNKYSDLEIPDSVKDNPDHMPLSIQGPLLEEDKELGK